jgi:NADH:ubiquinone oxidoreductase subunit F (NADH-binding)
MTASTERRAVASAPNGTARLLAGVRPDNRPVTFAEHLAAYGHLETMGHGLIDALEASGLRGRGGGGFPTGQKLAAVASVRGRPVVVVNATEGEPASSKDRALLRTSPHLVLDGAAAVAAAIGARDVIIAVGRRAKTEAAIVAAALRERRDPVAWQVAGIVDGFVAGEETAVLNALNGKPAKPSVKPPYPYERGLGGAPTLVQNAETLAHVALIARFGAPWFRSCGAEAEPGTALVTVSGAVARPGVYEIALGTRLSALLTEAGGASEQLSAVLVGGFFGGWTRDPELELTSAAGLGAGVIVAFPRAACGLREGARVARYLADESAGQCGPCVHGLNALASGLEAVARGRGPDDRARLGRWAEEVAGRGACHHPDGAARFVQSTLTTFEDEVRLHLESGRCSGSDRAVLPVDRR